MKVSLIKESLHRCNVEIDGTVVLFYWDKGFDVLRKYILEWEKFLRSKNKDIKSVHNLTLKYEEKTPRILYKLAETPTFRPLFIEFVVLYGMNFYKEGIFFTKTAFCKALINNQNNPQVLGLKIRESSALDAAMEQFYKEITYVMKGALNKHSNKDIYKIYKTIGFVRFINLATGELIQNFKAYLDNCMNLLSQKDKKISFHLLIQTAILARIEFTWLEKGQQDFFIGTINEWKKKNNQNNISVEIGANYWSIPYTDVQTLRSVRLDFSSFLIPKLKLETHEYLMYWYKHGESPKMVAKRYQNILRATEAVNTICPKYETLLDITYVEVLQMSDYLQQMKDEAGKRKYSITTIASTFSEFRLFFDWLKKINLKPSLRNPFRRIGFSNLKSFSANSEYIPDDVADRLTSVIYECPVHVQRTWIIMMNTGMRASEVLKLEENCLAYNEKEKVHYINYIPYKVLKYRRKSGLDDYHSIPLLSKEVVEIIQKQIEETKTLREIGKTSYIFIKYANSRRHDKDMSITGHAGTTIANSINHCIRRNNIKDHNQNIWHYSNHQCRKTVAVKLLTAGSSILEVGEILGHARENTTRQYYQDVDALKIAELDRELFEQLFDSIDEEIRKSFTMNEFEQLKTEIMTGVRETPEGHGSCLKHVSFGPCHKRSCVGCSLLLTGPQKLSMWRKLYSEQKTYIEDIIQMMKKQGIENYTDYRDYQAESHLLSLYADTINKIETFIKERMPKYEEK